MTKINIALITITMVAAAILFFILFKPTVVGAFNTPSFTTCLGPVSLTLDP